MSQKNNQGRIGPNAIIRVYEAMEARRGRDEADALFAQAGLSRYLGALPEEMVDEQEVIDLQQALRDRLGVEDARLIAREAGSRTGDYLLSKRIPRPAQALLSILPPKLASRTLLKAIQGNSWTFVGTGVFEVQAGFPPRLKIANSPLCRGAKAEQPLCDFYAGTFERLFQRLVHPRTQVTEIACMANGATDCLFEARW